MREKHILSIITESLTQGKQDHARSGVERLL